MQAVTKQGEPRTKTECDRGGQRWYAREVKESKSTSWMDDIAREVLEVRVLCGNIEIMFPLLQCIELRQVPDIELPTGKDLPRNQSKVEKPEKSELVEKHQTRLKLGNPNR